MIHPHRTMELNLSSRLCMHYYECVGIISPKDSAKDSPAGRVDEDRNRTIVEASRTMLIFSIKAPMFIWADAVIPSMYSSGIFFSLKVDSKVPPQGIASTPHLLEIISSGLEYGLA
ncbi:hypothetical protein Tco_0895715 [Tanacetum coccineum]|uniref:Uncharacterized protein n=1 Tax=Tanacetum coccineum TaxID=301880 RepID=A0ABQ5CGH6_9ASTR